MDCISVLLATYRQEPYIYQAIDSVLKQNYEKIQLIVADDCSEYFNEETIRDYICKNKRDNIVDVQVLKNATNLGTVKSLNNARQFVMGRYLVPLAGDDMFYDENTLKNYAEAFAIQTDAVGIIVSQVQHCNNAMDTVMYNCVTQEHIDIINTKDNHILYGYLCMDCFLPAIGSAYDMQLVEQYGAYDESYYLVEDWPYYLRLVRNGVQVRYADFVSAKHRDGGVSHSKKDRKSQRNDLYHRDLIAIMKKEILPNYRFAAKKMYRKVYTSANDRVVISEFRKNFAGMNIGEKFKWFVKHYYLPGIVLRGVIRRIDFKNKH